MKSFRRISPIFSRILSELRSALTIESRAGVRDIDSINWETLPALEFMPAGLGYSFDPCANAPQKPSRDTFELSTMSSTSSADSEYDTVKKPLFATGRVRLPNNSKKGLSFRASGPKARVVAAY